MGCYHYADYVLFRYLLFGGENQSCRKDGSQPEPGILYYQQCEVRCNGGRFHIYQSELRIIKPAYDDLLSGVQSGGICHWNHCV